MRTAWLFLLLLILPQPSPAVYTRRSHKKKAVRAHHYVVHTVFLGPWHIVPFSPNPDAANPTQSNLKVRALVIDGRIADWTTGPIHLVTESSYTVRQALRVNDALPNAKTEHWIWQLGAWLSVDRVKGHVTLLHLPGYDPRVSSIVWFRDLAAYCGIRGGSRPQLTALVARLTVRKALLSAKLGPWNPAKDPSLLSNPACAPATWQLDPLRVNFQPTVGKPLTYSLADDTPILIPQPTPTTAATSTPIPIP
jgi:hypothetical protein